MFWNRRNKSTLNSFAAAICGVSGWQQGNIIHIDIDVHTLYLAAAILITTSILIAVYHLIKERYEKHLESQTSNNL